jgi:hypothetical protein
MIFVCDDSGSMGEVADPDTANAMTRWQELVQLMQICMGCVQALGLTTDVYFLNRRGRMNAQSWADVDECFHDPPRGYTNTIRVLQQIQTEHMSSGADSGKPLIIHLFTDGVRGVESCLQRDVPVIGHPTDANGNEDVAGLARWQVCVRVDVVLMRARVG